MARPATVTEGELLHRLTCEFRRVGYEGASLASLSEATGLKKASLYHRFPGGKEQMAREVLATAHEWLDCHILQLLRSDRPPRERIEAMVRELDAFYDGGRQACLLNVLAAPLGETGPFAEMVRESLESWIEALTAALVEAGIEHETARKRARSAIALIQGSLVMAQGLQTTAPFQEALAELRCELSHFPELAH